LITLSRVGVSTPKTLGDALQMLERARYRVIAGGTDVVVQMKEGALQERNLLNIYSLDELRYIRADGESLRIGALTCLADLAESWHVREFAPVLAQAAEKIGSVQVTNKGTIGGNLGNASPSGDCIPPLYALDGRVVLASVNGRREVAVEAFFKGYKQLDLRHDELITEINFRKMGREEDGLFLKHTLRLGEACSVVSVAVWLRRGREKNRFKDARVALGAVAPTVVRAHKSEEMLKRGVLDEPTIAVASRAVADSISPITDVRGTAEYRREMAVNLTYRALRQVLEGGRWRNE
jgi:CO/xanthine dehydrogenase FAD-binding subunit